MDIPTLSGWFVTRLTSEGKFVRPHSKRNMKHFYDHKSMVIKDLKRKHEQGEIVHESDDLVIFKYFHEVVREWLKPWHNGALICKRVEAKIDDEVILALF